MTMIKVDLRIEQICGAPFYDQNINSRACICYLAPSKTLQDQKIDENLIIMKGYEDLKTDHIWTFEVEDYNVQSIVLIVCDTKPQINQIARLSLPLSWFPIDSYICDSFQMRPTIIGISPLMAKINVHLSNKNDKAMSAVSSALLFSPSWRTHDDDKKLKSNKIFKENAKSLVYKRTTQIKTFECSSSLSNDSDQSSFESYNMTSDETSSSERVASNDENVKTEIDGTNLNVSTDTIDDNDIQPQKGRRIVCYKTRHHHHKGQPHLHHDHKHVRCSQDEDHHTIHKRKKISRPAACIQSVGDKSRFSYACINKREVLDNQTKMKHANTHDNNLNIDGGISLNSKKLQQIQDAPIVYNNRSQLKNYHILNPEIIEKSSSHQQ